MNDSRSPLGDKKLTFIGIFTVLSAVLFMSFNYNERYSDVKAAEVKSTEVITENQKTSTNPVEVEEVRYIDNYFGEEKARISHKSYVYQEYYGVPENVKIELEKLKAREEDVDESEDNDTPNENATNSEVTGSYYGCLELTAYTWTGNPCADGVYPSSGYTVACNNSDLWHHWIYIEGYGNYYVHDTGGMGYGVIDVYMDSYDACIQFGRRTANIYVID